MYTAELRWHRDHFASNVWSGAWRDQYIQIAAIVIVPTVGVILVKSAFAYAMSTSDLITIAGGVGVVLLAGTVGVLKAITPILEIWFKHRENMARLGIDKGAPQMPDSSEVNGDQHAKPPDSDRDKVQRVRRRRKDKPHPPDEASPP